MEQQSSLPEDSAILAQRIAAIRAKIDAIAPALEFAREKELNDILGELEELSFVETSDQNQILALQQLSSKKNIIRRELSDRDAKYSS